MHSSLSMILGGRSIASCSCQQVLEVAAVLPGHLGLGLPSWAAALGLGGRLGLVLHWGRRHRRRLAWGCLAPSLGVQADLHPPHDIVGGGVVSCHQNNWVVCPITGGDTCNVLESINPLGLWGQIIEVQGLDGPVLSVNKVMSGSSSLLAGSCTW